MPLCEDILVPGGDRVPGPYEYGGPDHSANTRRMKETNGNVSPDLCDRLAAAAKERGRPLTPTEYALVAQGKSLPPVLKKEREKTLADLEAIVRSLTERLDAVEAAQKKSVAPHLREREIR
jgi:hypothetical protein